MQALTNPDNPFVLPYLPVIAENLVVPLRPDPR